MGLEPKRNMSWKKDQIIEIEGVPYRILDMTINTIDPNVGRYATLQLWLLKQADGNG